MGGAFALTLTVSRRVADANRFGVCRSPESLPFVRFVQPCNRGLDRGYQPAGPPYSSRFCGRGERNLTPGAAILIDRHVSWRIS